MVYRSLLRVFWEIFVNFDDTIRFNVYIFNIQDGVELNYADGSSLTEEEIAEKDRIAAQNEDQDRIAAEEASVQAEHYSITRNAVCWCEWPRND